MTNPKSKERELKVSGLLIHSLLDRQVIPKIRIKYFIQPEYNLTNIRKSRLQVFEHNAKSGSRIFEDRAFLKCLKYFIFRAELPWELKVDLLAGKSNAYYESEFLDELIYLSSGIGRPLPQTHTYSQRKYSNTLWTSGSNLLLVNACREKFESDVLRT